MKNNQSHYYLKCVQCGQEFTEKQTCTVCKKCGEALDVIYDYDRILSNLNVHALRTTPISATKYLRFYPLCNLKNLVTLSEGGTPLLKCRHLGKKYKLNNLYVKNEGANPTGVFKDRGSLVEITKAIEMNAKAVCCASTGNMAASVSAYAAIASLPCYVLVPEGTPMGKLAQSLSYGARVIQIRGTYADCVLLAEKMAETQNFYLAGDYAFRLEGHKSIAYEIIEQLFWKAPDAVICPMGCGTNISAVWKGFKEFHQLGFIDKLPRMIGVQPEAVPTIVLAFQKKKKRYVKVEKPSTVATAVGIGVPQDDIKALRALRESKGFADTSTDEEILMAEHDLAKLESLFTEASGAIPIASLPHLLEKNVISKDDTVVCIATGNGLKDPKTAISLLPDPPVLEPNFSEIERYLKLRLFEIKGSLAKGQILFKKVPGIKDLTDVIKKEFGIKPDAPVIQGIHKMLKGFLAKGRSVTRSDLQNIIESFLNEFSAKKKVLELTDFSISDSKHTHAKSEVTLIFHGKKHRITGEGDGIFDAIIAATQKVTNNDGMNVKLTDYSVDIATGGTAAVVKVRMTLEDKHKNTVVATATSPDVIVASTEAYEKGYNILYWKNG